MIRLQVARSVCPPHKILCYNQHLSRLDQVCMMEDKSNADIPADKDDQRSVESTNSSETAENRRADADCGDGQWPCNRPMATTAVMMTPILTSSIFSTPNVAMVESRTIVTETKRNLECSLNGMAGVSAAHRSL